MELNTALKFQQYVEIIVIMTVFNGNRLRLWEKTDFMPRSDDIFQERLYAIHWMRLKKNSKAFDYEFRTVTTEDLHRENVVEEFIAKHLVDWQEKGWLPDMRIEPGIETTRLFRERGWTHWHHLFSPRHLLVLGLLRRSSTNSGMLIAFSRTLDYASKLCQWTTSRAGSSRPGEGGRTGGASDNPSHVFYNQALNTFLNYGCRASLPILELVSSRIPGDTVKSNSRVECKTAQNVSEYSDLFITDPPYGDAVNYDEILEYFIAWIRKNPPSDFADWIWDSRRSLAIKGQARIFDAEMVAAYQHMTEHMSDNGMQSYHVHPPIWFHLGGHGQHCLGVRTSSNCGLVRGYRNESVLREGSYVKGTVLLVLRKRAGHYKTTRDDLAWEIKEEVDKQIDSLSASIKKQKDSTETKKRF